MGRPLLLLSLFGALPLVFAGCARHRVQAVAPIQPIRFGPAENYGPGIVAASPDNLRFTLGAPAHVIVLRVTDAGIEQARPRRDSYRAELSAGSHQAKAPTLFERSRAGEIADAKMRSSTGAASRVDCPYGDALVSGDGSLVVDAAGRVTRATISRDRAYASCARGARTRQSIFQSTGPATIYDAPLPTEGYWLLIVSDAETGPLDFIGELELPGMTLLESVQLLPEALVGSRTTNWAAYYVAFTSAGTP